MTTAAPLIPVVTATYVITEHPCGFCITGHHDRCPGRVRNSVMTDVYTNGKAVTLGGRPSRTQVASQCPCGCAPTRCLDCKRTTDLDLNAWSCMDRTACAARCQARLASDPTVQKIREIRMTSNATEKTATPRTPAAPKVGVCVHTGRATKGGKFAPGQDAAYVSTRVQMVGDKQTTEAQVLKEMKGHGLSETLQDKFVKALGLRREAAAKKVERDAAAAAKKKADAAEAKVAAAAAKDSTGPADLAALLP